MLCQDENNSIYLFIFPIHKFLLYSSYINEIYNTIIKIKDVEGSLLFKKVGVITSVLLIFCSNIQFYVKENVIENVKEKYIKKINMNTYDNFKNKRKNSIKKPIISAIAISSLYIFKELLNKYYEKDIGKFKSDDMNKHRSGNTYSIGGVGEYKSGDRDIMTDMDIVRSSI